MWVSRWSSPWHWNKAPAVDCRFPAAVWSGRKPEDSEIFSQSSNISWEEIFSRSSNISWDEIFSQCSNISWDDIFSQSSNISWDQIFSQSSNISLEKLNRDQFAFWSFKQAAHMQGCQKYRGWKSCPRVCTLLVSDQKKWIVKGPKSQLIKIVPKIVKGLCSHVNTLWLSLLHEMKFNNYDIHLIWIDEWGWFIMEAMKWRKRGYHAHL